MNRPCERGCGREAVGLAGDGRALCAAHLEADGRRAAETPVADVPPQDTPRDGGGPEEPARADSAQNERTPGAEAAGGASPEVETGDAPNHSDWRALWEEITGDMVTASAELERLQNERRRLIRRMRGEGMAWAQIGEITGLTRARLNQLHRG